MNKRGIIFFIIIMNIFLILPCIFFLNLKETNIDFLEGVPKEAIDISSKSLYLLKNKNFEELKFLCRDFEKNEEKFKRKFKERYDCIKNCGKIKKKKIIGRRNLKGVLTDEANVSSTIINYQIECEYTYFLYQVRVDSKNNDEYKISNIYIKVLDKSLDEINKFDLKNGRITSYLFICFGIFSSFISFYTASIAFSRKEKKYVFWTIMSLVGGWRCILNWTTGNIVINIFQVGLPIFSIYTSSIYSPVMLSIRMPLGAFLYWLSRIKLKDKTTKIFGEYNEVKKIE